MVLAQRFGAQLKAGSVNSSNPGSLSQILQTCVGPKRSKSDHKAEESELPKHGDTISWTGQS